MEGPPAMVSRGTKQFIKINVRKVRDGSPTRKQARMSRLLFGRIGAPPLARDLPRNDRLSRGTLWLTLTPHG